MKPIYTGIVTVTGGRQGHARAQDGVLDLQLRRPPSHEGTNPEQLFGVAYAACFDGAVRLAAKEAGIEVSDTIVTAHVALNVSEPRQFDLTVELHAQIGGLPAEQTRALMDIAHEICPYSRAVRGNVEVTLIAEEFVPEK